MRYNPRFLHPKGQKMDKRFVQAHKEARWALWLTLLYLAAWLATAYFQVLSALPACRTGLKWPACWYRWFYSAVLGDGEVYLPRYSAGG
jgi:uncharacterized membrane protein YhdT